MIYQLLGNSELRISRIGFGCMSLKPHEPESENMIHLAIDSGINYFDTADLYDKGENEILLGKALKQKRNQIVLATKVGNQWRPDGSGWDWNPRRQYILKCIEDSLRRLKTDRIDLYQMHGGTIDDPIDEAIGTFEQLVSQGKIRYYGISSIRPNVIRYWTAHSRLTSVMMQYSLLDRRPEEECLELLRQKNIAVLARGSLAQGVLAGKPAKPVLNYALEEVEKAAKAVDLLSNEKRTAAQTAIQFVLRHPAITSAVVGMRTREQLGEAVGTLKAPLLSTSELETLRQTLPANIYSDHR